MKYEIDDWVLYKPFADAKSDLLREMSDKAVILYVYPKNNFMITKFTLMKLEKEKK